MEESKRKIEKYMQEATERMNANDLDSAAFKVRKALEVLVKELCMEMDIEINVKGKDKDSLNTLIGKIKEANSKTRVLNYNDIDSMYKVKQVGNIGSHDDEEKHLEKATGEVKVRNAIDTMFLLLESLSDNDKLKLKLSVDIMLENASGNHEDVRTQKQISPVVEQAAALKTSAQGIKQRVGHEATKVGDALKDLQPTKKLQFLTIAHKTHNNNFKSILKNIVAWDVLLIVLILVLYIVGGVNYAPYIGIPVLVLIDILIIVKTKSNEEEKSLHTVAFTVIAILLIAFAGVGSYFISPAYAATRALNNGDTESAKTMIQQKIEGNRVQETIFNKNIDIYYKTIVDEYTDGTINDEDAIEKLDVLSKSVSGEVGKKAAHFIKSIDAYSQGKAFYDNKNYTDAILMLSKVSKDFPQYNDAQEIINQSKKTYKDNLFKTIGVPMDIEECAKAIELLNDASKALPNDNDIGGKREKISTTYVSLLDKEVKAKLSDLDYDGATKLVSDAKKLLKENDTVNNLQDLVEKSQPKPWTSFHIIQEDNLRIGGDEVLDTYGHTYTPDNTLILTSGGINPESYATYNIGSDSKRIKGTLAVGDDATEGYAGLVRIETDNGEIFKQVVDRSTKPIPIDIDVSGTDTITFRVAGNSGFEIGKLIVCEMMVY